MTATLIVRPEAEADLAEAAAHYASLGHAGQFEERIDEALRKIAAGPLHYQVIYDQVRRVLVRRYPYAIFYVVLAVRRQSRDPARWPRD